MGFLDKLFGKSKSNTKASPAEDFEWHMLERSEIMIDKYVGKDPDPIIPDSIDGKPVTMIGESAFYWNTELTSVYIPDTITDICRECFEHCVNLSSVRMSANVTEIDNDAFAHCEKLEHIDLPDSLEYLGFNVFAYCIKLDNIVIPNKIKNLSGVFIGCKSLAHITVPETIEITDGIFEGCACYDEMRKRIKPPTGWIVKNGVIQDYYGTETDITVPEKINGERIRGIDFCAFSANVPRYEAVREAHRRIRSVIIPDTVEFINSSFSKCVNLTELRLPRGLNKMDGMCDGCSSLSHIEIPAGIKEIVSSFQGCGFKELILPDTLEKIDLSFDEGKLLERVVFGSGTKCITRMSFSSCGLLTDIVFNDGLEELSNDAFYSCHSLKTVYLPAGLRAIENHPFRNCENLTAFKVSEDNPYLCEIDGVVFTRDKKTLLLFPSGRKGEYVIPEGTEKINDGAFMNSMIERVVVPGTVKEADFFDARKLKELVLCEGVEKICESAFYDCCIDKLILPSTIREIGDRAFQDTGIKEVVLPEGVRKIGNEAFFNQKVYVPASVTEIGEDAFDYCKITTPKDSTAAKYAKQNDVDIIEE